MLRATRSSIKKAENVKENVATNNIQQKVTTAKTKNKRRVVDSPSSDESSSPKSSRSNSMSPLSEKFSDQLNLTCSTSKFQSARRALADNSEFRLPGREKEYDELSIYLNNFIESEGSGSLYISGAPGTGKTATLSKLVNSPAYKDKLKVAFINCTAISSIGAIYRKICSELNLKISSGSEKDYQAAIEKYLTTKHKMTLLVLDEIDQLCSVGKKQNVLYQIFEWPLLPKSKLILVGIANSLDLTDRMLVRLQANCQLKPKDMHFSAYTKAQIVDIFKSRLEDSGVSDLFPPAAIQLLAAKVSAVSGDVRRALNIGKRVVELAELEKKKNIKSIDIKQFEQLIESDGSQPPVEQKPQEEQKIQLKEVVSVLNAVYGNAQKFGDELDESFPVQQKILICTLLLMIKHDKNKNITIGRLHEIYKKVCKNRNIVPTDFSEFVSICLLAEVRGIVRIVKKKESRMNLIQLQWDENEVHSGLKDKQMITNILNERSLLSR